MARARPGPPAILNMKRRVTGFVGHMNLDDVRAFASQTHRREWMTTHFGGWSQGLDMYLSTSLARRVRKLRGL